jgi:hypothetical protein
LLCKLCPIFAYNEYQRNSNSWYEIIENNYKMLWKTW